MAQCITCGSELHPDRAKKYNYCMKPECQEKNLKGLTMVAVGVNKSAEQYMLLDEKTKDELASGKFADQRRGSFGTSVPSQPSPAAAGTTTTTTTTTAATAATTAAAKPAPTRVQPARHRPAPSRPAAPRRPWTKSQERLALLYNEQGKRPEEIADKLGLSRYTVTQIILTSRNQGKL
jgi:DNA-directed RNA polymerase subunit N (RpoN/RPB10)